MVKANVDLLNEKIFNSEAGAQFYSHYTVSPNNCPEGRLMAAVLLDAVELLEMPRSDDPKRLKDQREAACWVADRGNNSLFSFNMVWTVLFGEQSLDRARRVLLEKFEENGGRRGGQ